MEKSDLKSPDCSAVAAGAERDSKLLSLLNSSILRDLFMAKNCLPFKEEGKWTVLLVTAHVHYMEARFLSLWKYDNILICNTDFTDGNHCLGDNRDDWLKNNLFQKNHIAPGLTNANTLQMEKWMLYNLSILNLSGFVAKDKPQKRLRRTIVTEKNHEVRDQAEWKVKPWKLRQFPDLSALVELKPSQIHLSSKDFLLVTDVYSKGYRGVHFVFTLYYSLIAFQRNRKL